MPATFWLFWHILQDRRLLDRVQAEVDSCQTTFTGNTSTFDTTALCNQPLLQSTYAETLRKYIAVYIIRKPEHEDAQIMNYRVPKDKMIVVSSASAHMDKRNWNVGTSGEHPVDQFWADRFLTYTCKSTQPSAAKTTATNLTMPESTVASAPLSALPERHSQGVRFSLNGYGGAWIPFGGGIHQCPGRHWVKLQMILSFAMINKAFEIELLDTKDRLRVDMRKFGLGALQPAEKARFRIRRSLASEGEELHVQRRARRSFEHWPKACIAKELSILELKIVVCLVTRNYDITAIYGEQDGGRNRRVGGVRAYQVGKGEPGEFLPCTVEIRIEEMT
ncbi:MAG: hypothetical protein Q9182_007270 [Xanthomendoza sp. 2 TL-2023]